jgi:hypothetical protein
MAVANNKSVVVNNNEEKKGILMNHRPMTAVSATPPPSLQRTISRRRSSAAAAAGGGGVGGGISHNGMSFSEDGSLSSDGGLAAMDHYDGLEPRDEEKEVAKLARWETNNVRCWRTGVFLMLLILGATISTVLLVFFQQAEQEDFKVDVRVHSVLFLS